MCQRIKLLLQQIMTKKLFVPEAQYEEGEYIPEELFEEVKFSFDAGPEYDLEEEELVDPKYLK